VLPYGSGTLQTLSETPLVQMIISGTWMAMMTPVHSTKVFCRWTVKHRFLFPLLCDTCNIRDLIVGIPYLVRSRYRYCHFTRSRDIPSMWSNHTLQLGCNVTEWAQSIFPSRGRTNPGLDTYASTHPIGIPELHLSDSPISGSHWCSQGSRRRQWLNMISQSKD